MFRYAQGAKTINAMTATIPIARARTILGASIDRHAKTTQMNASHAVSFRVSAPSPKRIPSARRRTSVSRAPSGRRTIRVMSMHADRTITAKGIVESGRAELRTSGR